VSEFAHAVDTYNETPPMEKTHAHRSYDQLSLGSPVHDEPDLGLPLGPLDLLNLQQGSVNHRSFTPTLGVPLHAGRRVKELNLCCLFTYLLVILKSKFKFLLMAKTVESSSSPESNALTADEADELITLRNKRNPSPASRARLAYLEAAPTRVDILTADEESELVTLANKRNPSRESEARRIFLESVSNGISRRAAAALPSVQIGHSRSDVPE
jgi:hypothetical protein